MDIKYQIFVSSTYSDLVDVRSAAFESILSLGHIPIGNEFIPATNDNSVKYMNSLIEMSDIVILILGNKYGSLTKNGLSYIEAEYLNAIEGKKPVLVFIKSDFREVKDSKYQKFVCELQTSRIVCLWNDINDFKIKLLVSLSSYLKDNPPKTYWKKSIIPNNNDDLYLNELQQVLTRNETGENSDILGLMLHNIKEIKEFYSLTKEQAKKSFDLSVWMCILGFFLFAFSSVISIFWKENFFALLTTLGGVVVEVIAGTSLLVYKRSLSQLNYYYSSLHNNERFLSLINISGKTECKDGLYTKIIESELERFKLQDKIQNDKK